MTLIQSQIHSNYNNNAYFNLKSQELARQHRNKTASQKNQVNKTLEGVVVNNFINDETQGAQSQPQSSIQPSAQSSVQGSALNMDDICNTLIIPTEGVLPQKSESIPKGAKEGQKSSLLLSALPLAATALALVGGGLGLTKVFQKSAASLNDKNILNAERQPVLAMNMNIKQEPEFAAYMALRNPNKKTIFAMIGVFVMSGLTLIGKGFVDGVKDVWVKKKEAQANKDLQESLIEIETKSFRGKLDVVRDELSSKAKYFNDVLSSRQKHTSRAPMGSATMHAGVPHNPQMTPFLRFFGFKGGPGSFGAGFANSNEKEEKSDIKNSPFALAALTLGTLALGIFMGRKMFKNFVAADNEIRKFVQSGTNEIEAQISTLTEKLKGAQNKEDGGAELKRLKELLQIKRADSFEVQNTLKTVPFLNEDDINQSTLEIMTGIKSIYGDAPETLGGKIGQIQYYCYLDENRGHLYNWIMNPENPFAAYLFLAFTTISAAGYSIKKAIEGVKEAAVIKENTNTERELQEKLIDVEIRNFKSKKQSAIEPLMAEFNAKAASNASNEELKIMADNILLEIKNGPPFVYA